MFDKKYKYLDVGCKVGNSFDFAKKYGYKTSEGLGVDINKERIIKFKKKGYEGLVADATNLPFEDKKFELVIFNHVIEHLPDEESGKKAFKECMRVCNKTMLFGLPFFDEDNYLNSLGFKTFYSDWDVHTNMIHLSFILKNYIKDQKYNIKMIKKIENSFFKEILPINAKRNSDTYDEKIHGEKKFVNFDREIFREYIIEILL